MCTPLRRLSSLIFLLAASCAGLLPVAPTNNRPAFNQLAVSGNACGPAALLTAFRFGDRKTQAVVDALPGISNKEKLSHTLTAYGQRPSAELAGRTRWSKAGVNLPDLAAMANDLTAGSGLPAVQGEVLQPAPGETGPHLLAHCHDRFAASLRNGLPPVVSVRRQVLRKAPQGGEAWITIDSHFITLTRLEAVTGGESPSFGFDYIDPWGARRGSGTFRVSPVPGMGLEANLPASPVGKRLVHPGEETVVNLSAAVVR